LSTTNQELVRDKVEGVLKHFDRVTALTVTVDLNGKDSGKDTVEVEIRASVEHSEPLVAVARTENLAASCDAVVEKMEAQLRKHKERLRDHHATPAKHIPADEENQED
jgi:putative sigma-54 modulation protein